MDKEPDDQLTTTYVEEIKEVAINPRSFYPQKKSENRKFS